MESNLVDAAFIDQFYKVFVQVLTVGMVSLSGWVSTMFVAILSIRIFYIVAGFMEGRENMFGIAVAHIVPIVLLTWLSVEWITVTRQLAGAAMELGQMASGNHGHVVGLFQISEVILNGFNMVKGIWDYAGTLCTGPVSCAKNLWFMGYFIGASVIIIIAQFFIAYIVFRSTVEFNLHCLATLAMMPFAGAGQTAWVIQNGFSGLVAHLVNLMLLSTAVNIGQPMMETAMIGEEPTYQVVGLMGGAACMFAGLCFLIRKVAMSFTSGGPNLSPHGGLGGAVMGLVSGVPGMITNQIANSRRERQRLEGHGEQGGGKSIQGTGSSHAGSIGHSPSSGGTLSGRQWADSPSPYAAGIQEAKTGYRNAFEKNVAATPDLPPQFADNVRKDFAGINDATGARNADLMRQGYWEQFGFGDTAPPKQTVGEQPNPQINKPD